MRSVPLFFALLALVGCDPAIANVASKADAIETVDTDTGLGDDSDLPVRGEGQADDSDPQPDTEEWAGDGSPEDVDWAGEWDAEFELFGTIPGAPDARQFGCADVLAVHIDDSGETRGRGVCVLEPIGEVEVLLTGVVSGAGELDAVLTIDPRLPAVEAPVHASPRTEDHLTADLVVDVTLQGGPAAGQVVHAEGWLDLQR